MTNFTDALNVTLSGWTKAGGVKLEASDITAITNFLQTQDFDGFLLRLLANNPASLAASEAGAANAIPIVYSGNGVDVDVKAFKMEAASRGGRAFDISETQFGIASKELSTTSELQRLTTALEQWSKLPISGLGGPLEYNGKPVTFVGLRDVVNNFGSPAYAEEIIAKGIPARGVFGSDAKLDRGFGALARHDQHRQGAQPRCAR